MQQGSTKENYQYFYHPDHLGSSAYLTDVNGTVSQHIEYLPYGELFLEERNNRWNTPYLFNAKELDEETGLYYYEQRYLDSRTSIWLSVDELRGKYPNVSGYNYCLDNPIKFVDRDGRNPGDYFKTADAAALDFALLYNDNSITESKEYATVIVKVKKDGKMFYTYLKPTVGGEDYVYAMGLGLSNEGDADLVVKVHTHGSYSSKYKNNEFSDSDKENGYHYVATPNGSLLKYNNKSGKTEVLNTNIPSDYRDPQRQNSIDVKSLPKNEPTYKFWDFVKRNIISPILIGAESITP